jgi:cysteine desulfurase
MENMKIPVYFDNHATTPVDERVVNAMLPYFSDKFGNASSRTHSYGWDADAAVELARKEIADLIHASPDEIIFTSGATESNNLALKGVSEAHRTGGGHIITAATEHRSVLDVCRSLERQGYGVTVIPVDREGIVSTLDIENALTSNTFMISVMMANNEIGTLAPLAEIGALCSSHGILFHTDAVQAASTVPINVKEMHVDLMSLSAHKMYGPKGIGALYMKRRLHREGCIPQIEGGGQESGVRSGTLNVPAIVGFGKAAAIARTSLDTERVRLTRLRDRFITGLRGGIGEIKLNGHETERLSNNINFTIPGISAATLMMNMKDIACSSGSACSSAYPEPSHVLHALGTPDADIRSTIRIGLGRFTTDEEIEYGIQRITGAVESVKGSHNRSSSVTSIIKEPA